MTVHQGVDLRTLIAVTAISASATGALAIAWRRDPRIGSAFGNTVVNPWLLERGLAGGHHSKIGPLEHIGRTSGIRRLAPVHPEPTVTGFRFIVPPGTQSEWVRTVLAAGRCRVQLHEQVCKLAKPRFVSPNELTHLPKVVRAIMAARGFRYLTLETVAVEPGTI